MDTKETQIPNHCAGVDAKDPIMGWFNCHIWCSQMQICLYVCVYKMRLLYVCVCKQAILQICFDVTICIFVKLSEICQHIRGTYVCKWNLPQNTSKTNTYAHKYIHLHILVYIIWMRSNMCIILFICMCIKKKLCAYKHLSRRELSDLLKSKLSACCEGNIGMLSVEWNLLGSRKLWDSFDLWRRKLVAWQIGKARI